jgi:DNA-binding LacI/PurR family transcriptional regulator
VSVLPSENSAPRSSRRRNIQFVCDFYVPEVHAGVVDYAREAGWSLSDFKCFFPSRMLDEDESYDGILTIATLHELSSWLKTQCCPVLRLLCSEQDFKCPSVEPDSIAIGERAAEHLLMLGSPLFAFYRLWDSPETRRLWEGFSGALAKAGKKAHFIDFSPGRTLKEAFAPRHQRCSDARIANPGGHRGARSG